MALSRDHILSRLETLRPDFEDRYNVRIFGLFGSRARGDATADSDMDIAYRWLSKDQGDIFDLGGVWHELNAEFGVTISLVDWDYAKESFRQRAARDMIAFYG